MAREPREAVKRAVAELAAPDQPAARRYAALDTLNLLPPDRRDESPLLAFERALDAKEPQIVSLGLLALSQSRRSVEAAPEATRARLAQRVDALRGHYDAGVRGHSLLVLAELPSLESAELRARAAERAMVDREPYVRARAADLFARLREPRAIHLLIEHVGDLSPARYELRGWSELGGGPGNLVHELPGRKRVAEAVLFAVHTLGEVLEGSVPFVLTLGGRGSSDELVLENAGLARAWYRANQLAIPGTDAPRPPPK